VFFYDKITKNKEEFNILICSRLRIMNLHVGMSKKTKKPIKLRKPKKITEKQNRAKLEKLSQTGLTRFRFF